MLFFELRYEWILIRSISVTFEKSIANLFVSVFTIYGESLDKCYLPPFFRVKYAKFLFILPDIFVCNLPLLIG